MTFIPISSDDVLSRLHKMIDEKFNRKKRSVKINIPLLKKGITLWAISNEFDEYPPELISKLLNELVEKGAVVTNIDEKKSYPFDAYFIPKTEL